MRSSNLHQLANIFGVKHIGFIISTIMVFFINNNKCNQMCYYDNAAVSNKRQRLVHIRTMTKQLINNNISCLSYLNEDEFLEICHQRYGYNKYEMKQYVICCGYLNMNKMNNLSILLQTLICAFFIVYNYHNNNHLIDAALWYPFGYKFGINILCQRANLLQHLVNSYIKLQIKYKTSTSSYFTNINSGFDFDIDHSNEMNIIKQQFINPQKINDEDNYDFNPNDEQTYDVNQYDEYVQMILIHGFYRELDQNVLSPIAWLIFLYYSTSDDNESHYSTSDDNESHYSTSDDSNNSDQDLINMNWSQSRMEVELFLDIEVNITSKNLDVIFEPKHIYVAVENGKKIILNDNLKYNINVEESSWFLNKEYDKNTKTLWIILIKEQEVWWNGIFSKKNNISETIIQQDIHSFDIAWSLIWCV